MIIPKQCTSIKRHSGVGSSRYIASTGIRAALSFGMGGSPYRTGAAPKCSCVRHGDSTLFECCKIGTDECRACVGETTDECCKNLIDGKPSPVPIPLTFVV